MRFRELTDEQWEFIHPLIPHPAREGRPRADDRRTINAIMYVLTTGCRWMDLPVTYGDEVTAWRRLRRWEEQGVWVNLLDAIIEQEYSEDEIRFGGIAIDSTDVAAKKGGSSSVMTVTRRSRVQRSTSQ
jgi:transposase